MAEHPGTQLALLEATVAAQRSFLRARRPEDVVAALERLVHTLGGSVVPGHVGGDEVLHLDIALGVHDPLLPWAPPDDPAREHLQGVLPTLLEDARRVVHLLWARDDLEDPTLRDELTGALHADATRRLVARGIAGDTLVGFGVASTAAIEATHGRARVEVLLRQLARFVRSELDVDERLGRLTGPALLVVLRRDDETRASELASRVTARWERQRELPVAAHTAVAHRGEAPDDALAELYAALQLDEVGAR